MMINSTLRGAPHHRKVYRGNIRKRQVAVNKINKNIKKTWLKSIGRRAASRASSSHGSLRVEGIGARHCWGGAREQSSKCYQLLELHFMCVTLSTDDELSSERWGCSSWASTEGYPLLHTERVPSRANGTNVGARTQHQKECEREKWCVALFFSSRPVRLLLSYVFSLSSSPFVHLLLECEEEKPHTRAMRDLTYSTTS